MLAMPSYKDSIHLSYQNALLAGKSYSIHDLEEENAALKTSSADRFLPGATRRTNLTRVIEHFACDDFRMYEYKVRRCMRGRSHDWTDCPFTHPGEKARRRDPRKIHYSGSPCPDFRKGSCQRGDACEYAHGVFECWLHPARYRTQACKDGKGCTRRVCFFAHSTQQLRHVGLPVEESLKESVSMVDSHVHELDSHTHDLGSPLHRVLLEDSFKGRVSMVDSHECELGLQMDSSEDCLTAMVLPTTCGADCMVGLSSQDVCSISETLSMLTLSSQNVLSSPLEAVSTMGFSSNNRGVTLDMVSMVHPPSPKFSSVAPGPSDLSSDMGATSQDHSFTFEWSSPPAVFSPASNLQLYAPFVGGLSSSRFHTPSEHSSYVGGSPSEQAAAWQTFLMREGYSGGGEPTFSESADEFSDMVYYRGYGDVVMQQGYFNAIGKGLPDVNEVANESNGGPKSTSLTDQLALLRKEMYEFSNYNAFGSYGLPSPTSTLAGPLYSPPFSSPPVSPLSSEATNVFASRGHGNVQVDDTSPKADAHIQNRHCVKEFEFTDTFTHQQSLHSNHQSRLLGHGKGNTALPPHLESHSFSQCTSGLKKWSPPCNSWNSEDTYNCDLLQLKFDMQHKICGRFGGESPAENAMPDLGWVHELVM